MGCRPVFLVWGRNVVVAVKTPTQIVKRSGETVEFKEDKIYFALRRCFESTGDSKHSGYLDDLVSRAVNTISIRYADTIPTVEQVQDIVVFVLQSAGEYEAAEHYI